MNKVKSKTEQCEELLVFIKENAEAVAKLIDRAPKPNKFLVRDLLALIVSMREDVRNIIDRQLFEE